jgi:hypothetical protein
VNPFLPARPFPCDTLTVTLNAPELALVNRVKGGLVPVRELLRVALDVERAERRALGRRRAALRARLREGIRRRERADRRVAEIDRAEGVRGEEVAEEADCGRREVGKGRRVCVREARRASETAIA